MNKKIKLVALVLSTMVANGVLAQNPKKTDGVFSYSLEQDTNIYSQKIDLNNLSVRDNVVNDYELTQKEYNRKSVMSMRIGVQEEEFEEKKGFFIQSTTPSIDLTLYKRILGKLQLEFDFQITKSNLIARQGLSYPLFNFYGFSLSPVIKLGEKIAITDQVNSGYFFLHTGGQLAYENRFVSMRVEGYSSPSSFKETGIYGEILYKSEKNQIGFYYAKEHYNPIKVEYLRQGQTATRLGLVLKF